MRRAVKRFYTLDTTMFDSTEYAIGDNFVEIWYHEAEFEGDKHYVDVVYHDGDEVRMFNIDFVEFA